MYMHMCICLWVLQIWIPIDNKFNFHYGCVCMFLNKMQWNSCLCYSGSVHVLEIGIFEFQSICVPAILHAFIPGHRSLNGCFLTLPKPDECLLLHSPVSSLMWQGWNPCAVASAFPLKLPKTLSMFHEMWCCLWSMWCCCGSFIVTLCLKGLILDWSHSKVIRTSVVCMLGFHSFSLSLFPSLHPSTYDLATWERIETVSGIPCSTCYALRRWQGVAIVCRLSVLKDSFLLSSDKAWAYFLIEIHVGCMF